MSGFEVYLVPPDLLMKFSKMGDIAFPLPIANLDSFKITLSSNGFLLMTKQAFTLDKHMRITEEIDGKGKDEKSKN